MYSTGLSLHMQPFLLLLHSPAFIVSQVASFSQAKQGMHCASVILAFDCAFALLCLVHALGLLLSVYLSFSLQHFIYQYILPMQLPPKKNIIIFQV